MKIFRQVTANNITLEPYPFTKELAMEAYLMENESVLKLDEPEFYEQPEVLDAEIALVAGGRNGDGRIDLLARYSENTFAIIELKHKEINLDTLKQLEYYLRKRNDLESYIGKEIKPENIRWIGVLAGETICPKLQSEILGISNEKLDNGILKLKDNNNIIIAEIPIAAITMKRYRGSDRKEIFVITDSYFNRPNTNDYSYYTIKFAKKSICNKPLRKNAAVEKVIEHYANTKSADLQKLIKEFPATLSGSASRGCFDTVESISTNYPNGRTPYMNKEIKLNSGESIRVYNGWTVKNIDKFIEKASKLDYTIEKI